MSGGCGPCPLGTGSAGFAPSPLVLALRVLAPRPCALRLLSAPLSLFLRLGGWRPGLPASRSAAPRPCGFSRLFEQCSRLRGPRLPPVAWSRFARPFFLSRSSGPLCVLRTRPRRSRAVRGLSPSTARRRHGFAVAFGASLQAACGRLRGTAFFVPSRGAAAGMKIDALRRVFFVSKTHARAPASESTLISNSTHTAANCG